MTETKLGDTDKFHPTSVPGCTATNRELGKAIAAMRYDQVIEVLIGFADEIFRQAVGDRRRGRLQLSGLLTKSSGQTLALIETFERVSRLCRPYMQHELDAEKTKPLITAQSAGK